MLEMLRSMRAHMMWANRAVLDALRQSPGNDPQTLEYYAHVLAAEHVWLERINGRKPAHPVWPKLTFDECEALAAENAIGYERLFEEASEESLGHDVAYVNSAGQAFTSRIADILTHVMMHGAYHRGQISLMVRRGGGTPAPTDFIAFIRGSPAATRQPR